MKVHTSRFGRLNLLALLALAVIALTLAGCGGNGDAVGDGPAATGSGETTGIDSPTATPAVEMRESADSPTATPAVATQQAGDLTTQEYAEALEAIGVARDEMLEEWAEALIGILTSDRFELVLALETSESWSQEDRELASDFAEIVQEGILYLSEIVGDYVDEVANLTPPEHLSELHGDLVATYREAFRRIEDFLETLRDADTDIRGQDELAEFMEVFYTIQSSPAGPELEARIEAACLALQEQLEAELERDVKICNPESTGTTSTETDAGSETAFAEADRAVLIALYNATDGPNWSYNINWLSDEYPGRWYGVEIEDGRVVGLRLNGNALGGELPVELGQLSSLQRLYLFGNELSGAIPSELGHLSNLVELRLDDNNLSGAIPAELGQLSRLETLALYDNNLTGAIPAELGQLSNLINLLLAGNGLSGEIPAELGQLSNLGRLWLSANSLSGCVPDALRDVEINDFSRLQLPFC
ncbi:MAG: hypothetical protein OXK79_05365 [Chloroflexota bacterium]|nr:hypothetical protein [Chloroflexota bacterium]